MVGRDARRERVLGQEREQVLGQVLGQELERVLSNPALLSHSDPSEFSRSRERTEAKAVSHLTNLDQYELGMGSKLGL